MKFKTNIKPTLPVLNGVVFALVLIIGVAYIAQVNHSSTKGFALRDLQKHIDQLAIQNEQLEYQVAQKESVNQVKADVKMLGMVPVGKVAYATAGGSSVAINQ